MSFIRDSNCDISQYLPDFILSDTDIKSVLDAESNEHDKERLQLKDMLNQFWVDTATWGLDKYEELLAIQPAAGDNYEQRRARILLKLQSKQTSTLDYMTKLAKRYMSTDASVTVTEQATENRFTIVSESGSINYPADLIDAIETYKPAHLIYRILLRRVLDLTDNNKISVGVITEKIGKQTIDIAKPLAAMVNSYAGCINQKVGKQTVDIAKPTAATNINFAGIYTIRRGRIIIGGIR